MLGALCGCGEQGPVALRVVLQMQGGQSQGWAQRQAERCQNVLILNRVSRKREAL